MSGAWSLRHSAEDRPPSKPESPTYREAGRLARYRTDERHAPVSDREAERLAQKIVSVGADYQDQKSRERFGEEFQAPDNAPPTMDAEAMANKLMKEAAREMMRADGKRNDGQVFPGSDTAKAEAAYMTRNDPGSPMHKVAEKVREKMEFAEERAGGSPHAFVGPNPYEGSEGASEKKRHMRNFGQAITGGLRGDRNPDVLKD